LKGKQMGKESIDYRAVIDDIERKRAALNARFDAAVVAIQQIIAMGDEQRQPILPELRSLPMPEFANTPYHEMGMAEAALKHLEMTRAPVPNLKLAAALESGGFRHKSKNFPNTLNSVLWRRAKAIGDIRKTARGWEVAAVKQRDAE
jgi:hypothetical protein